MDSNFKGFPFQRHGRFSLIAGILHEIVEQEIIPLLPWDTRSHLIALSEAWGKALDAIKVQGGNPNPIHGEHTSHNYTQKRTSHDWKRGTYGGVINKWWSLHIVDVVNEAIPFKYEKAASGLRKEDAAHKN